LDAANGRFAGARPTDSEPLPAGPHDGVWAIRDGEIVDDWPVEARGWND
jgi:hypothetical protein